MKKSTTYIDLCLSGKAMVDDIDHYIEKWHTGDFPGKLWEYLGMSKMEYEFFVEEPKSIKSIFFARKNGISLEGVDGKLEEKRFAARASDEKSFDQVFDWLKRTKRI